MKAIPNKLGPVWAGHADLLIQMILKENPGGKTVVITDENVYHHCYPFIENTARIFDLETIVVKAGETSKQLANCELIWNRMAEMGIRRDGMIIAFGGGMITDLAGFIASTYMRGIGLVSIPTTLLAQADAAIGGKNGIDLKSTKNYIGTFYTPEHIVLDHRFLNSLPERQIMNGMAEVVKHALIAGGEEWKYWSEVENIASVDWNDRLEKTATVKIRIVEEDFREKGLRRILNLGHSIGHAIESTCLDAGLDVLHGEAVAAGLWCECWLSKEKNKMQEDHWLSVSAVLETIFTKIDTSLLTEEKLLYYLRRDKKNRGGRILVNGLVRPGEYLLDQEISEDDAVQCVEAYRRL